MRRTTISLPDDLAAALQREAARRGVPVSQVAREAIEARLGWDTDEPRDLPFAGIGASTDGWTATEADEYLAKHWPAAIAGDALDRDR